MGCVAEGFGSSYRETMRGLWIVLPVSALVAACSVFNKTDEGEVDETGYGLYVTLPSEELARKTGTSLKDLHIGFGTYVRECGTCHPHVLPDDLSSSQWHVTTPKMAWNANISDEEQKALLSYLIAATKDPGQPDDRSGFRPIKPTSN